MMRMMKTEMTRAMATMTTGGYSQEKDSAKVLSWLGSSPPRMIELVAVVVAAATVVQALLMLCLAREHDTSSSTGDAICIITLAGRSSSSNSSSVGTNSTSWCLVSGQLVLLKLSDAADDMSAGVAGGQEMKRKEE